MNRIIVPLADGFEEIEAITIIDVLRRGNIEVTTVYLKKNPVTGSHGITVIADKNIDSINPDEYSGIILPGGMPGSKHLKEDDRIINVLKNFSSKKKHIGAICAAPIALGKAEVLNGKKATCFPGNENELIGATIVDKPYVVDENVITGKAAGTALTFSLKLVEILNSKEVSDNLRNKMQVYWKDEF